MQPTLQRMLARLREGLPGGIRWKDMLLHGQVCLAHSRNIYPQHVEEMEGIAEGAGAPLDDVFTAVCSELWEPAMWYGGEPAAWYSGEPIKSIGCTDFAARGRATISGSTLLGHTNDLEPSARQELVILKIQADREPQFLGVSVGGLWISAGFNSAGISLTGNHLAATDVRPGVPRLLVVRAILGARTLGEAMGACLLPQRASSYNNIIADKNGEVYSMEGSATDCVPIYIDDDVLAHANHYTDQHMREFEASPGLIGGSVVRHNRAMRLLRENYGQLSPQLLQEFLADHVNYPDSICKHSGVVSTVFGMIIDLGELRAWIGPGNPCQTEYEEHCLEPWEPPAGWPR